MSGLSSLSRKEHAFQVDPLTFFIAADGNCEEGFRLTPCSPSDISGPMWEELAACIAREPGLLPCPASVLAQRCKEGDAELTVHAGRVVHYSSFAPIARAGTGPHSWAALVQNLDTNRAALPTIDVYELATGWTDPAWRGLGINRVLRQRLVARTLDQESHACSLGTSGMAGVAAPLDKRLGWQVLSWHVAPFVTSLIGVVATDFPDQAATGWRLPATLKRYESEQNPREDPAFKWEEFCFCWVSSADLAARLNIQLSSLMDGNLSRWRSTIVATFGTPESSHRLAFLP